MHRLGWWMPAILTAMAVPPAASAQTEAADGIVVEGRKPIDPQDIARELPRVLAVTGNAQVARWSGTICLETIGLRPAQSRFVLDRFKRIARAAGRSVRAGGNCENRALILFTDDWASLLPALRDRHSPLATLVAAPSDAAPVRWASDAEMRGADGERPVDFYFPPERGPMRTVKGFNAHAPTRLARATRMDLQGMTVVVDASHLPSVSNGALAAYLAMVVLGNVRADHGAVERSSILNLFAAPSRTPVDDDLSDWDRRYLSALYAGVGNLGAERKKAEMIAAMAR